jgi:hypothetical protein
MYSDYCGLSFDGIVAHTFIADMPFMMVALGILTKLVWGFDCGRSYMKQVE